MKISTGLSIQFVLFGITFIVCNKPSFYTRANCFLNIVKIPQTHSLYLAIIHCYCYFTVFNKIIPHHKVILPWSAKFEKMCQLCSKFQ